MRRALFAGLAVVGGAAMWWAMPTETQNGQISLADLGPREACACEPMPSPIQREWLACAVTELDKVGCLEDATFARNSVVVPQYVPTEVPAKFTSAIHAVVDQPCGTFEQALAKAQDLQERREAAGYEEYTIFASSAGMFAGWSADNLRQYAREIRAESGKS